MPLTCPLISVVIACYDQHRELELSLISFLRQNVSHNLFEIIVVDDDSPDHGARYVVAEFRRQFPNAQLNYVRQYRPNGGTYGASARAKNIGLRLSCGEYVYFNNAEIVQAGESLEYLISGFSHYPSPLCLRGVVLDLAFEQLVCLTQSELEQLHDLTDPKRERVATADHAGLAAVSRKLLLAVGGNDERFDYWGKEDIDLAARLKRAGATYFYDKNLKSFHISHRANHVKEGDYLRMVALLDENDSGQILEANLGYPWGTLNQPPVEELDETIIVEATGDVADLTRRLEETVYTNNAERREVLVVTIDSDRRVVEPVLNSRFRPIKLISLAPENVGNAGQQVIQHVRTDCFTVLPVGATLTYPDQRRYKTLDSLQSNLSFLQSGIF